MCSGMGPAGTWPLLEVPQPSLPCGRRPQAGSHARPRAQALTSQPPTAAAPPFGVTCIWVSQRQRDGEGESHTAKIIWASYPGNILDSQSIFSSYLLERCCSLVPTQLGLEA